MSLLISNRSEHDFTGRNRLRGTLTPCAPLKCLIAAPAAVSSWMTGCPSSVVFGLTMISKSMPSFSMTRFTADNNALRNLNSSEKVEERTFQIDPKVIRVEDLEFADCIMVSLKIGKQ